MSPPRPTNLGAGCGDHLRPLLEGQNVREPSVRPHPHCLAADRHDRPGLGLPADWDRANVEELFGGPR